MDNVNHFITTNQMKTILQQIKDLLPKSASNNEIDETIDDIFKSVTSLNLTLSSDETNIDIVSGDIKTININAIVKLIYNNGTQKNLNSNEYTIEWNSYNNAGITFENGILSIGSVTVVGTYSIPIIATVKKDKYSDTDTFTINVNITSPINNNTTITYNTYDIYKNGEVIDQITLDQLKAKIQDGSVINDYGYDSQIVVTYTDPEYGYRYDYPFNFGTYQEFKKEDGTKFMGLGLIAEYGLGNLTFDAAEPSGADVDRKTKGNNRWRDSNLRQWMNKFGKNWFVPQHEYDAIDYKNRGMDPYKHVGLLSCFPEDFVETVIAVKNSTKTCVYDGGGYDITYDKFFPLSLSQINCLCTDTNKGLNDESEGRYWDYWRIKSGATDYWSGSGACKEGLSENTNRIMYKIEAHSSAFNWWVRSANLSSSYAVWLVYPTGYINYNYASGFYRIIPACVIG